MAKDPAVSRIPVAGVVILSVLASVLAWGRASSLPFSPASVAFAAEGPTFNKDIAPLIFTQCATCHRTGQVAPMSLLSYDEVRPWAQAIKNKVASREMPPWHADPRFGHFRNDPSLSQDDINRIVQWVDSGAPRGAEPLPPAPRFAEGWNHPSGRPPDIVMEMPLELAVPATGLLPPFAVYSELPKELATRDHFVEAVQLRPGNTSVVHHSAFSMRALPAGVQLGSGPAWPGGPVLSHMPVLVDRTPAGLSARRPPSAAEAFSTVGPSHFVFFFPGNNGFAEFGPGVGKRIRPQDYVEWSVHYAPSGHAATDRERVGLWLQRVPPTHEMLTMRIGDFHIVNGQEIVLPAGIHTTPGHAAIVSVLGRCDGVPCPEDKSMIPAIPPQAANWKLTAITPFQDDVTLHLAYPHGHLRLTDMTYVLTFPDGREETILSVPRFDFNWQQVYEWVQPLRVPAGSTIKAIGHYDNSSANRRNPGPDKEVFWSEQTIDEMFNGYVDMSIDRMDVRLEATQGAPRSDASSPKVPMVNVVGCFSPTTDGAGVLTNASDAKVSAILHADAQELAAARATLLGAKRYRLLGTADFGSTGELLWQGQRAQFTREQTANTTASFTRGRKVAVKGLLIPGSPEVALNVLSAQPLADSCP
jgi:hypothetical protein